MTTKKYCTALCYGGSVVTELIVIPSRPFSKSCTAGGQLGTFNINYFIASIKQHQLVPFFTFLSPQKHPLINTRPPPLGPLISPFSVHTVTIIPRTGFHWRCEPFSNFAAEPVANTSSQRLKSFLYIYMELNENRCKRVNLIYMSINIEKIQSAARTSSYP